ncbi:DUF881 domain-containing protein [Alkalibacter saccharofermentans]|uniref:Uncharacterized conserved protein YlxW, UPF0749 family n=1 Tax=Alkalibacter saccharofermentans DSM 14828 TaxID=1120975 RepID=A0A1M4UH89_9FIRM|nr:DUF881 domain-containing protein [Alkalibacter saccharofermentans]SHE56152.1 Uncharacterized conserved protein YlxW, UPF0749 family [Alkalibacter saccharofermentans DSM 14828]
MKKFKGRVEIAVICVIIGVMIVLQMQTIGNLGGLVSSQRADDLLIELNQLKRENTELSQRAGELSSRVAEFESQAADNSRYIERLLQDVSDARTYSGQTDLEGEGLQITLDYDSVENDGFDPFLYNSELLLLLVNELNAAGAEAISINGERLVSISEIRLAGSHININGARHSRPFVFKVIGDAKTLRSAILIRAGIADIMRANYISVSIEEMEELTVEKYDRTINFRYAKPVGEE